MQHKGVFLALALLALAVTTALAWAEVQVLADARVSEPCQV